jgi:hypothetical protein
MQDTALAVSAASLWPSTTCISPVPPSISHCLFPASTLPPLQLRVIKTTRAAEPKLAQAAKQTLGFGRLEQFSPNGAH